MTPEMKERIEKYHKLKERVDQERWRILRGLMEEVQDSAIVSGVACVIIDQNHILSRAVNGRGKNIDSPGVERAIEDLVNFAPEKRVWTKEAGWL